MIAVPIVTAIATYIWVTNLTLADRPRLVMTLMCVAMVVISAILALAESSNLGMGQSRDRNDHGPVTWLLLFLGIWIIALPVYMKRRSRYGLKDLFRGGLLAVVLFVGAYLFLNMQINVAEGEQYRSTPTGVSTTAPPRVSEAMSKGYQLGLRKGDQDRRDASYSSMGLGQDVTWQTLLCPYSSGSAEFGDFWAGYSVGYREAR